MQYFILLFVSSLVNVAFFVRAEQVLPICHMILSSNQYCFVPSTCTVLLIRHVQVQYKAEGGRWRGDVDPIFLSNNDVWQ